MIKLNASSKIYFTVLTALCASLITITTAFLRINTGFNEGYIHLGDCITYICACLLPIPYAPLAAAVGSALADLITGAAVWMPFTAVIKALNTLPFACFYLLKAGQDSKKIVNKATALMPAVSGVITVLGYFLTEWLIYSYPSAVASVPFNIAQAVCNAVIFLIAGAALDKIDFKKRISNRR